MNYLLYVEHSLTPKNNLEKEDFYYLQQGDRRAVAASEMEKLQHNVKYHVDHLNQKHKRCRPVELSFRPMDSGDIAVFVGDGIMSPFRATFLKVAE